MSSSRSESLEQYQELSLDDILIFLRGAYKTALVFGFLGISIAITYLAVTPKVFEATSRIVMAQTALDGTKTNGSQLVRVNVEEPALLMARLSLPTSFDLLTTKACDIKNVSDATTSLAGTIKLSQPKGLINVLELKTFGNSPESAKNCGQAIFGLIKTSQEELSAPYIEVALSRLAVDIKRLDALRELVAKSNKSETITTATYFATKDEIRFLSDEIAILKDVISTTQARSAYLLAPIYASDTPIAPKKLIILFAGLFSGLLLGLLLAFARQSTYKKKYS